MAKIGVVINTCALGVRADVLSSGSVPHSERIGLLESLLHRLSDDANVDEIVVAGEWRDPLPTERWRYVSVPSLAFDCTDALHKREAGAKATTADVLVFLHDDHIPAPDFFPILRLWMKEARWDVLVPTRKCKQEEGEVFLNNGSPNYVMGHCAVLTRAIWQRAPWSQVPKVFTWDVGHTFLLIEAKATIRWVEDLVVYDAEAQLGATPWA